MSDAGRGDRPPISSAMRAKRRVRLEALRAAAREKVERTSLRTVAREVGISAPGLSMFLQGSTPRDTTVRKLREWFFSEAAARAPDVSPDAVRAALSLLVEGLPEPRRARLVRDILRILLKDHERQGTRPPGWLEALWQENTPNGK